MNTNSPALARTLLAVSRACLLNALLLTCGLFGLGWSSNALAIIGCEIQQNVSSPTTQSGPAGTTLTFKFDIISITGGCAPTVSGTINKTFDSTGTASAPTTWSGAADSTVSVVVTLGATSGGVANFTVDCPVSDCTGGNSTINWAAQTDDVYTLTADPPPSQTVLTGHYATMNAHYFRNGVDNNNNTNWNVTPGTAFFSAVNPVPTDDSTGLVTNALVSYTGGTYTVTVDPVASECGSLCPAQIGYTVIVEAPVLTTDTPASGAATIPQNSSTTLKVKFSGPTLPVDDGTHIDWTIESPSGAGTFTPNNGNPELSRTDTTGGIAQVDLGVTVPGTYVIQAGFCPDGCNQTVTFTITVPAGTPGLTVTKALTNNADGDGSGTVTEGDVLTYKVTANNSGTLALNNVQVTDPLTTPSSNNCATLAIGADCILSGTYTVTQADVTAGTISNTGHAQSTEITTPVDSNTVNTPVVGSPALTATKALTNNADGDDSGTITVGDVLTYDVTAHNAGNVVLNNVQVSDPITTPSNKTCATLAIGADCVLSGTYTVTIPDTNAGSISNTGHAQSTEIPNGVDSNTLNTPITGTPGMSVNKVITHNADGDNSHSITLGDVLTYSVIAHNHGNVVLHNVHVTDPLTTPSSKTCATVALGGDCTLSGDYTVTQADVTAGSISNTGHADSTEFPDGIDSNTLVTPVKTVPVLTVSKTMTGYADNDSTDSISQGDVLTFKVTAHNGGNVALANVQVSDPITTPNSITCASLAIGADCVLTGTYTISAADADAGTLSNTGSAQSTQTGAPVTATVVTAVAHTVRTLQIIGGDNQVGTPGKPLPAPFVVKAEDNGLPAAGVGIVWTITTGDGTLSVSGNSLAAAVQKLAAATAASTVSNSTDSSGLASATLTLGPEPGPVDISVNRQDDVTASVTVSFSVNAALLGDLPGLNPKEKALADAIDKFCSQLPSNSSNSGVADLYDRCHDLIGSIGSDPNGVINALDELFPDLGLVLSESSLLAAEAQFDNIKARIAALRSGTQGVNFGGLALSTGRGSIPIGLAFQSLLTGDKKDDEVGSAFSRWGFFASGAIGKGKNVPGQVSPGYDFDINGLTVGADYRKSDKFILGGTVGYTKQTNDLADGRGSLDTQGYSVSAFSTYYKNDSWYVDDVLSYGRNSYDMQRSVHYTLILPGGATSHIDQSSHGSSNGNSLTFATSVGRDFTKGGLNFGPYLRGIYSRLTFDPLTEQFQSGIPGSGLGMVIDTHDVTSVTSTLGAKLTFTHSTSWGVLIPHLQAEWQHEFKSDPSSLTAYFLNDPTMTPFTVTGDPVDTDFYRMGVGLSFVLTHGRSGFIYYEHLMGKDRVTQNSLAFGLRLEF